MKNFNIIMIFVAVVSLSCGTQNSDNGILVKEEEKAEALKTTAICIWKEVSVKDAATEKGKYLTSVFLGERFTVLGDTASENVNGKRTHYSSIQLTDGTEGWIRTDLIAVGATGAAFIQETAIYKRPDLMTSTSKTFSRMDFVAIKTTAESGWVEVIGKRAGDTWFTSGWVKKVNLTERDIDVAFSILYQRAMDTKDAQKRQKELEELLQKEELSHSMFFAAVENSVNPEVEEVAVVDSTAEN